MWHRDDQAALGLPRVNTARGLRSCNLNYSSIACALAIQTRPPYWQRPQSHAKLRAQSCAAFATVFTRL